MVVRKMNEGIAEGISVEQYDALFHKMDVIEKGQIEIKKSLKRTHRIRVLSSKLDKVLD